MSFGSSRGKTSGRTRPTAAPLAARIMVAPAEASHLAPQQSR
jgi:hypothetical protein